ncbi:MAG TPA: nucleoside recognition domain-containing protein [Bacillota bacterium]
MIDLVWLVLILGGVAAAAAEGRITDVTEAAMTSAQLGVETVLGFVGIMVFWLGLSRIAEEAGLIQALARAMAPLFRTIFPSIPRDHPALGAIMMNLSANMLGLGHAATPFGLKAMQELQKLNDTPDRATDAMCTFLALNTSSVTLIPATVIALRASAQSANPTEIVAPTLVATGITTAVALIADYVLRHLGRRFG